LPAKNIVVEKDPHRIDSPRAHGVKVGFDNRYAPRAVDVSAKLECPAATLIIAGGTDIVDAAHLEVAPAGAQTFAVGRDRRQRIDRRLTRLSTRPDT
jgi:hypothetical protein